MKNSSYFLDTPQRYSGICQQGPDRKSLCTGHLVIYGTNSAGRVPLRKIPIEPALQLKGLLETIAKQLKHSRQAKAWIGRTSRGPVHYY